MFNRNHDIRLNGKLTLYKLTNENMLLRDGSGPSRFASEGGGASAYLARLTSVSEVRSILTSNTNTKHYFQGNNKKF